MDAAGADERGAAAGRWALDRSLLGAVLVCAVLGLYGAAGVSHAHSLGWDESVHAEYPAVRMLLFARDGEWSMALHALHDCMQYPFAWPVVLAAVQAVTGVSEMAARATGRVVWAVGLLGIFLLAREVVARRGAERRHGVRGDDLAPWLALAFAATSPLALSFSGTLFLEIPFTVVSVFALRAWLRRGEGRVHLRELVAGAWLALGFFTKFNYGLLLGFGLSLALAVEAAGELRAGRGRRFGSRALALAAVPLAGFAWWLLWPLPAGPEMGRLHREALVSFLSGNLDESMRTQWQLRPLHAGVFLVWAPRVLAFLLLGAALSLRRVRERAVGTLWIAWLASTLPVLLHPFHHDRFLLPGAVYLWVLAAVGVARVLPPRALPRAAALAALALALSLRPDVDSLWLLERLGMVDPRYRDYQVRTLAELRDLTADRRLETNGLARAEFDALIDLLEPEVRPDDRVAWVGMTQNFSPVAMHVGLLERGAGAPADLERGEIHDRFVEIGYVDPEWSRERLLAWASRSTLVLATDPVDMVGNVDRAFLRRYRDELASHPDWRPRLLGTVTIHRVDRVLDVRLFALRRTTPEPSPAR